MAIFRNIERLLDINICQRRLQAAPDSKAAERRIVSVATTHGHNMYPQRKVEIGEEALVAMTYKGSVYLRRGKHFYTS